MKLLIIEGPDRCGKNTLIKQFINQAENYIVRHWGSAKGETDKQKEIHQYNFFKKEFELASKRSQFEMPDKTRYPNDIYIWNRAHLGEFVYGRLYRDTNPNLWVFNLEKQFGFDTDPDVYLLLLTAPAEFLCKKDDGQSFTAEVEGKKEELRLFLNTFHRSEIRNKLLLDVTSEGEYRDSLEIFKEVNEFVFKK